MKRKNIDACLSIFLVGFICWCFCWTIPHVSAMADDDNLPKLLLISFDGFRWDYMSHPNARLGNFTWIQRHGVHAERGLKNAFITKTFPNHITLVTGLYEESHGVVGNTMFDPVLNETFNSGTGQVSESKWMDNGGEPIWVTNQRQHNMARSGAVYWVGDGAIIKGFRPYRYLEFDRDNLLTFQKRIDTIVDWFTDPLYPINLGVLYFEEPDATGHKFGPYSKEIDLKLTELNDLAGYLIKRLNETGLLGKLNVVITSDHGMSLTPSDKILNLDNYINPESYRIFQSNPIANILPNDGVSAEELKANLSSLPNAKVYLKEEIPEEFHYKHNRRIQPLLIVSDNGYSIVYNHKNYTNLGDHGYNNSLADMHPFFMATGPHFKKNASVDMFHSVDVYPMMCAILRLKPAPNNGTLKIVSALFETVDNESFTTFVTYIVLLALTATVVVVFAVGACRQHRFVNRKHMTFHGAGFKYSVTPAHHTQTSLLSDSEDDNVLP